MLKFEKLLSDNQLSENDADFPNGAKTRLTKIRKYQEDLATADAEAKADLTEKINKLDDELMEKLNDYFDVIDEAAEAAAAKQAEADQKAADKATAEKAKADKIAADKVAADKTTAEKAATEKAKAEADKAEAARKKQQDEADSKPAQSNAGALEKLFKKGKTSVTKADLTAAGFDTGFFGPIGPNGCSCGSYRLSREDQFDTNFTLSAR